MLNASSLNPNARIISGFEIHRSTLDSLGPLEREFARKLIADKVWVLVPDDEATP